MAKNPVAVRHVDVPLVDWPAELDGLRIAHVSDFHFRQRNRVTDAAQELLLTLDYDWLVATGDFGGVRSRWRQAVDLTAEFFEPVAARRPVYAVLGNHDDPRIATARSLPLEFLRNTSVTIQHNGTPLQLAGVDQNVPEAEDVTSAIEDTNGGFATILLAHYPSTIFRVPAGRVALVLSGHTHGGQIRIPGLGCLWPNDAISRRMARGLSDVGRTKLHVTAGIGVSPPIRVRINCPPEVSILTLSAVGCESRCQKTAEATEHPEPEKQPVV